jgi:hypothetical protein
MLPSNKMSLTDLHLVFNEHFISTLSHIHTAALEKLKNIFKIPQEWDINMMSVFDTLLRKMHFGIFGHMALNRVSIFQSGSSSYC